MHGVYLSRRLDSSDDSKAADDPSQQEHKSEFPSNGTRFIYSRTAIKNTPPADQQNITRIKNSSIETLSTRTS